MTLEQARELAMENPLFHIEGDQRILTLANGREVRELIVDLDDTRRRLAYAVVGGDSLGLSHHHASLQVFSEGAGRCRLVWQTDLLPHHLVGEARARIVAGGGGHAAHASEPRSQAATGRT